MKWINEVLAILFWSDDWLQYCVHCHIALSSTDILDDPQTNDELNTFSNFCNQGTNLQFDSKKYKQACQCVCCVFLYFSAVICQIGC